MKKKSVFLAALLVIAGAAIFFLAASTEAPGGALARQFVRHRGARFEVDGKPFRFVGANVAVMYRDEDRERMPETLRQAAQLGIKVVRVWAFGEGGPNDVKPIADFADWPRTHSFRLVPGPMERRGVCSSRQGLSRGGQEQSLRAALSDKLVARHGRRYAIPSLGRNQRCRRR